MDLHNIKIVMVGTTHPGNIGAAARAMKNMMLPHLVLVDPQCPIGEIAYARASGAHDVLDNRVTVDSLELALADCTLVVATTARSRSLAWPMVTPRELAEEAAEITTTGGQLAIVFGREHSGLTNEEIQLCNKMLTIPTNPDFSSLNVASAIQVVAYEMLVTGQLVTANQVDVSKDDLPASHEEVEGFMKHLQSVIETSGFLNPQQPGLIMQRLRRLYQRAQLSKNEVNILRGILTSLGKPRNH